jgi:hypothetical protein
MCIYVQVPAGDGAGEILYKIFQLKIRTGKMK